MTRRLDRAKLAYMVTGSIAQAAGGFQESLRGFTLTCVLSQRERRDNSEEVLGLAVEELAKDRGVTSPALD